ncbi:MAG: N-acetyl-gamma-glutamyl-phosphate reductase, partial [Acidimicrobiia bacterium]|nr:N-acetyl-gamma-glutamyl-phosphate reductase [Acidimicrobiia bacterium]
MPPDEHDDSPSAITVGVVGASGFTGAELLRLLAGHPTFEVTLVTAETQAGNTIGELYPHLVASYGAMPLTRYEPGAAAGCEVVFCCLPHGASQAIVPELLAGGARVVDLAADFRLAEADLYPTWYGEAHAAPDLLDTAVYGLPELFGADLAEADLVAAAGCYPTAASLALAPLVADGLVATGGLVVDAASGVSGAG